ncbi:F-box-like/WD repeat-containing protein TBL1XR1 [Trichinella murrelli]|uniref:F-box-like/WD repeat-containing protein TBL1XR1 n=1 Tax=Trichinella murrelli TaxID=144512 RepID=A0A0V0TLR0_9BILA|nr:F-box-like/WD repeat-containing protein TBL1XR1 [Trichinella murrelli]
MATGEGENCSALPSDELNIGFDEDENCSTPPSSEHNRGFDEDANCSTPPADEHNSKFDEDEDCSTPRSAEHNSEFDEDADCSTPTLAEHNIGFDEDEDCSTPSLSEFDSEFDVDSDCSTPTSVLSPFPEDQLNFLIWRFFKDHGYHVTAEMFAEDNAVEENCGVEDLSICKGSLKKLLEMLHFKSIVDGDIPQDGNLYDLVPGECFLSESSSSTTETASVDNSSEDSSFTAVELKCIMCTNYNSSICSLDWSFEEDLLLTGSADKVVRLWNMKDEKGETKNSYREITCFEDENNGVNLPVSNGVVLVSWSPQGDLIASADSRGKIRICKKDGNFTINCFNVPEDIAILKWNVTERLLLTATVDGVISLWSARTGDCVGCFTPFEDDVTDADWKDGATFTACSKDGMLFHCCITSTDASGPFNGHENSINVIKWDPTGNMAATGSSDMMVKVWRFGNEECVGCLKGHTAEVNTLGWHSTDQAILASGSEDGVVCVWDVINAEMLHMLNGHMTPLRMVAFRPETDMLISCSSDSVICLWNGRNGKRLRKIGNGDRATVNVMMWNRSGQVIAVGRQDGTASMETEETNVPEPVVVPSRRRIPTLRMESPIRAEDLHYLVWRFLKDTGQHRIAKQFELESQVLCSTLDSELPYVCFGSMEILMDALHKKCVQDGDIPEMGSLLELVPATLYHPSEDALSPDTDSSRSDSPFDHMLQITDIRPINTCKWGIKVLKILSKVGHNSDVSNCAWNPKEDFLLTGSVDKIVHLWNLENDITNVDENCVLASLDLTTLQVTDCRHLLPDLTFVAWSPDGDTAASVGLAGQFCIWKRDGSFLFTCTHPTHSILLLKWSTDGKHLLTASSNGIIVIWTASTGEIYADYGPFSTSVTDADWKDDSTFSVCFDNGTLFHCSPTDPFVMSTFEGHQMRVNMIRWDPAGKMMASCSDDRLVRIWRLNSQTYDFSLCGHTAEVDVLCWHDTDRAILASGSSDQSVRVWNVNRGEILYVFSFHTSPICTLEFRPGSDILASSGLDNRIMLWNVKVGGMLNEIENDDQKRIYELAWNRNGEKLAIAKADGLLYLGIEFYNHQSSSNIDLYDSSRQYRTTHRIIFLHSCDAHYDMFNSSFQILHMQYSP